MVRPRLGGPDLARRLLDQRAGLKLLFTSGYNDQPAGSAQVPGAAFLHKPYRLQDLAARLRDLLDR